MLDEVVLHTLEHIVVGLLLHHHEMVVVLNVVQCSLCNRFVVGAGAEFFLDTLLLLLCFTDICFQLLQVIFLLDFLLFHFIEVLPQTS